MVALSVGATVTLSVQQSAVYSEGYCADLQ